jgi:RimJ/RimL family protein N-acetyltransferase
MSYTISLIPLEKEHHAAALQEVYRNVPAYWAMYNLLAPPADQAARDMAAAAETPGRVMMGMVKPVERGTAAAGAEMIGLVDFRLGWPGDDMAYIGMIMVAEPLQRQGLATKAWLTLKPWLATQAGVKTVRLGVEQFNHGALKFFTHLGFQLTGESNRLRVGDKLVRLLYMEREIGRVGE